MIDIQNIKNKQYSLCSWGFCGYGYGYGYGYMFGDPNGNSTCYEREIHYNKYYNEYEDGKGNCKYGF